MNDLQQNLLEDWELGQVSEETLLADFGIDLKQNTHFVVEEIEQAIQNKNADQLDLCINLIWLSGNCKRYIDLLNRLLLVPHHWSHQAITQNIQDIAHPSSIPFIKKVLESNFEYLDYTGSESAAIAKWFSWALASIGTPEAIDVLKEFSHSSNKGIAQEMQYRLRVCLKL